MHVVSYLLLCDKLSFGSKLGSPSSEDEKTSERNGDEWYNQLVFYVLLVTFTVSSAAIKKNLFSTLERKCVIFRIKLRITKDGWFEIRGFTS